VVAAEDVAGLAARGEDAPGRLVEASAEAAAAGVFSPACIS